MVHGTFREPLDRFPVRPRNSADTMQKQAAPMVLGLAGLALAVAGIAGCSDDAPLAPDAPHEGAVIGQFENDARQPAHVTASSGAPFEAGWFWVEGAEDRLMNGRSVPDGTPYPTDFLPGAGTERLNLVMIPATLRGATQELFLAWRDVGTVPEFGTIQGQFFTHDSRSTIGPQLTLTERDERLGPLPYPLTAPMNDLRHHDIAALTDEENDVVLVAWLSAGADDSRYWILHWRLVGRGDGPYSDAGTTLDPLGPVRPMNWNTGVWPVPVNECNRTAWGVRHTAVDLASGNDHFLMTWVAQEEVRGVQARVMATRVEKDGTRSWESDSDPGTTIEGCNASQIFDVVVDQQTHFGSVAAAYDSLRNKYLVVYTRRAGGSNYNLVGRFVNAVDGSMGDTFDINSPAVDGGATLLELPSDNSGRTLLLAEYNEKWDRYAVAFRTDNPSSHTLRVTELHGHHSPGVDRPIGSTAVSLDEGLEFIYGDLKAYETHWAEMERGCFAMAFEARDSGGDRDNDSQVRYMWWCDPW